MSRKTRRGAQHVLFALAHPYSWPRWLRRMALLGAPVVIPLWITLLCAAVAMVVVEDLLDMLAGFWNGRPHSGGGYRRRGARIRLEPSPDPVEPPLRRPGVLLAGRPRQEEEDVESGEHRVMFLTPRQRAAGE